MQQAPMTCGSCRGTFSAPVTLFQAGGTVFCPHCQRANVVGAQVYQHHHPYQPVPPPPYVAPPPPQQQYAAATPSKPENTIAVVLGIVLVSIGAASVVPAFGLVAGSLSGAIAVGYLAAPKFRGFIDPMLPALFNSNGRRSVLAGATIFWSFLLMLAAGAGYQGNREAEAADERVKQVVADKEEADRAARDALLASAKQKLAAGDLDGAQADLTAANAYQAVPEMVAISGELAAALREHELKQLPGLLADLQAHNAAAEWSASSSDCIRARAIDAEYAGLRAACDAAAEGERSAAIPGWIEAALAVANDGNRCDTPLDIAESWKNLRKVQPSDPSYKKAQTAAIKLEKCRKKSERVLSTGIRDLMVGQRVKWAEEYELGLLNEGMDVSVTLSGTHKNRAKIRWVLLSRPSVHQIVKDGTFLAALENIGFEKVTFSDGFYESWSYDLSPASEEGGGKLALEGLGLDKPLSL